MVANASSDTDMTFNFVYGSAQTITLANNLPMVSNFNGASATATPINKTWTFNGNNKVTIDGSGLYRGFFFSPVPATSTTQSDLPDSGYAPRLTATVQNMNIQNTRAQGGNGGGRGMGAGGAGFANRYTNVTYQNVNFDSCLARGGNGGTFNTGGGGIGGNGGNEVSGPNASAGGGAGFGGALFSRDLGTLSIIGPASFGATTANSAVGGTGNGGGGNGTGAGQDMFIMGTSSSVSTVTLNTTAGNIIFNGSIADDNGNNSSRGGKLSILGSNSVRLNAASTFIGGVDVTAGTLGIAHNSAMGTGTQQPIPLFKHVQPSIMLPMQ